MAVKPACEATNNTEFFAGTANGTFSFVDSVHDHSRRTAFYLNRTFDDTNSTLEECPCLDPVASFEHSILVSRAHVHLDVPSNVDLSYFSRRDVCAGHRFHAEIFPPSPPPPVPDDANPPPTPPYEPYEATVTFGTAAAVGVFALGAVGSMFFIGGAPVLGSGSSKWPGDTNLLISRRGARPADDMRGFPVQAHVAVNRPLLSAA